MTPIHITLNGAPLQLEPDTTLAELIATTGHEPQGLSTAVNGDFVARESRAHHVLREADAVFTFQPITGG